MADLTKIANVYANLAWQTLIEIPLQVAGQSQYGAVTVTPNPSSRWTWDPNSGRDCNYTGNGVKIADNPSPKVSQGALLWRRVTQIPSQGPTANYRTDDSGAWAPTDTSKFFNVNPGIYQFQMNDDKLSDNPSTQFIELTLVYQNS